MLTLCCALTGGMLSGVLEDDDGWFVAQLSTNQNETMGRGLGVKLCWSSLFPAGIVTSCFDSKASLQILRPEKHFSQDLLDSGMVQSGMR